MSQTNRVEKLTLGMLTLIYVVIFTCWSVYRLTAHNSELFDELVAKPLIWLLPLLFLKVSLRSLQFKRPTFFIITVSLVSGIVLALFQIVPQIIKWPRQAHVPPDFLWLILATGATAITEEVLFRGFFLQQLRARLSMETAVLINSLAFALFHVPVFLFVNRVSLGDMPVVLGAVAASGIVFSLLFVYTKTISSSIIAHLVQNILLLMFTP